MPITGKCHCGSVTYTINQALGFQFICQCHSCQRLSGSGHLAATIVQQSHFSVSGNLRTYTYTGGSGYTITSSVCDHCFSGVFATLQAHPDIAVVKAGTLDDQGMFSPQKIIHDDEKAPWDNPLITQ